MMALPVGIIATAFAEQVHRRDFIVTWGMISRVPLFAELDAAEISDVMELLRAQVAEPGEVIVREGDAAHSMYFIADGDVEIDLQRQKGAGASRRRSVFRRGGASCAGPGVRRPSSALSRTNLLALDAHDLHALMRRDPRIAKRIKDVVEKRVGKRVSIKSDTAVEETE